MSVLQVSNLTELEELAATGRLVSLSKGVRDYYASGADEAVTLADNRLAFRRYKLIPRVLRDVADVRTATTILGRPVLAPILVAPMAMQRMAHPEGERAVARACAAVGCNMVVSTMANYALDEVAAAAGPDHLWFQLYVFKCVTPCGAVARAWTPRPLHRSVRMTRTDTDRAKVASMLRRVEAAGYRAVVITVDAPFLGNRHADHRNRFRPPEHLPLGNAEQLLPEGHMAAVTTGGVYEGGGGQGREGSSLAALFAEEIDASLVWDVVGFVKKCTALPVLVKGILHPADAQLAVSHGADGIVVSNHGGRQLDHSVATIDVVASICDAVRGKVPVLVDGGVRRGTDVLKLLALGAQAVLVGRPIMYALAKSGQEGVREALTMLVAELKLAMALAGCPTIQDIRSDLVHHEKSLPLISKL